MTPQEKPKEKSVLTEAEKEELMDRILYPHRHIAEYPHLKPFPIEKTIKLAISLTEQKVLANYKKELREKVQEKLKEVFVSDEYTKGKHVGIRWLLRELGD